MRICSLIENSCEPHKESSASFELALVRRFLRPCVFFHLARPSSRHVFVQARCFNRSHIPSISQWKEHGLCSTLLLFRCVFSPRNERCAKPIRKTQKTPRRTCSGSPSTNFGLLGRS